VPRIVAGALLELGFSMLMAPVSAVAVTLFMLGLPFGRTIGWTAQRRDAEGVPFAMAARKLWPQTLFGIVVAVWLWRVAPGALWYAMPFLAGLVGAIPIAMLTAHPSVGRALVAAGLCRIPEEAPVPAGPALAAFFLPYAQAPGSAK
jgi:membrane glycosyltransferase